jgi:hypothetical protein
LTGFSGEKFHLPAPGIFTRAPELEGRKEVAQVKIMKPLLSTLLLTAAIGAGTASAETRGIVSRVELGSGGYCHLKFPPIAERTLGAAHPALKDPALGDVIDFYGPCDHDPLGKEEIWAQKLDHKRRMILNHE